MQLRPLPEKVVALAERLGARPRLVAHLTLVHDVACTIVEFVAQRWPRLSLDREAVCIGAATHDIGKVLYPQELTGPGKKHEEVGMGLLTEAGFLADQARFAWTHGGPEREPHPTLEDLLVRLADTVWKGKRLEALETEATAAIAQATNEPRWEVFMALDDLLSLIADSGPERLAWQAQHPAATSSSND